MNKTTTGLIAFGSVSLLAGLLLVIVLVAGSSSQPTRGKTSPSISSPAAGNKNVPGNDDPYPECAAIRRWLPSQLGDPRDVEILEWQNREVVPTSTRKSGVIEPGFVHIQLRIRARNDHGGKSIAFWHIYSHENGTKLYGNVVPH